MRRLREPSKFSTWLYQIAANLCWDVHRRRKRHPNISIDQLLDDDGGLDTLPMFADEPGGRPDSMTERARLHEILNAALQSIPEEHRVVVIMKEYQGLKFTEIAESLKLPVNTVKSRMYYGLRALRKVFDSWNINEGMVTYDL